MDSTAKPYTSRRWAPPPMDEPPPGRFDDERTVDNIHGFQPPPPKPKAWPALVNAEALRNMKFAPIRYVVPGYLAEGCTILAGAPKLGKSWLVLEWAISKATGGRCMGSIETPEAEDVLYLALEDNLRRLQSRMDRLMPHVGTRGPARLTFATSWPRANEGGLDRIREWAKAAEKPRLVIIDVLHGVSPRPSRRRTTPTPPITTQ